MRRTLARLANLFRRRGAERELALEIDAHLKLIQADFERRGLSPDEAALAARRAYGGVEQAKELHRETRSFVWIEQFFKDLRYGWKNLWRNPGFTLVAVCALALGIGVNATVFGIYNAVALKQLPVADPSRLLRVSRWYGQDADSAGFKFAYPEYQYLRDRNTVFSGVAASTSALPVLASVDNKLEHANGYAVSANYFADLGVKALIGRTFSPEEDRAGANPVVVLSYRFWQNTMNSDASAIGRAVKVNGLPYTIIGVAPKEFSGTDAIPTEASFWAPISMIEQLQPSFGSGWRDTWRDSVSRPGFQLLARLKDGVSATQAQAETDVLLRSYLSDYQEITHTTSITLQRTSYFGRAGEFWVKMLATTVLIVVSLVLLIACANVANMLLARGVARQREIGIRLALGAGRARVIRQLLTESVLLSLLGGAAAIPLSAWAGRILWVSVFNTASSFRELRLNVPDVSPDAHVLLYGLLLSALAGILFGLAPALQSTRTDLHTASKGDGAPFGGRIGKSRLRGLLLGTQVAVSVLLLAVSGGMLGGLASSLGRAADLGFETHDAFVLRTVSGYDGAKGLDVMRRLKLRLETLPGMKSVAHGFAPLAGALSFPLKTENSSGDAFASFASDAYFETVGIPLVRGRGLTRQESDRGALLAVISESTARRFWPDQDALGKRFHFDLSGPMGAEYEVVGIAKDTRSILVTEVDTTHVYLPASEPLRMWGTIVFRLGSNAPDRERTLAAVQTATESVDPTLLPSLEVVSLEDGQVATQRGLLRALVTFPGVLTLLALSLAGVGIYGVMAFLVSQRTREIGIRRALGASSRVVVRGVVMQGMWPVFVGVLTGLAASIPMIALIRARGFTGPTLHTPPSLLSTLNNPVLFAELLLVLFVAALAILIPARRALRVDPAVALRDE